MVYPRREGPWPGFVEESTGAKLYGLYDPEGDRFQTVSPEADPALPGLRTWLARGQLVSYRPGHRAVIRVREQGRVRYLKVLPPRKAGRLETRARAASGVANGDGPAGPVFPQLLEARADEGVLVFGEVPGRPLSGVLWDRAGAERALVAVGRSLARLHRTPAPASLPATSSPLSLDEWSALVARHFPDRGRDYAVALGLLRSSARYGLEGDRLVHGDLHDGNLLVDGASVGITDLDSLRAGRPADDVGNLCAHLVLRAVQRGDPPEVGRHEAERLVGAYREEGAELGEGDLSAAWTGTLLRLACLYLFRRPWRSVCPVLLDEAVRQAEWRMAEV